MEVPRGTALDASSSRNALPSWAQDINEAACTDQFAWPHAGAAAQCPFCHTWVQPYWPSTRTRLLRPQTLLVGRTARWMVGHRRAQHVFDIFRFCSSGTPLLAARLGFMQTYWGSVGHKEYLILGFYSLNFVLTTSKQSCLHSICQLPRSGRCESFSCRPDPVQNS